MSSNYPYLKLFTMLFPPTLIGAAEYIRHEFWEDSLSMEVGNIVITIITFVLSTWFAVWMFRRIETANHRLVEEEAKRAVYEERERLAGELHDNIAQALFFLNVKLQKGQTEEARGAVTEINNHLRQAIFNLRTMPEEVGSFPLRLSRWLEEWSGLTGIPCESKVELQKRSFSTYEEVQLFGLIQEAFTNIRKHSKATHASITLKAFTDKDWSLEIKDDGVGLEEKIGAEYVGGEEASGHYGLSMMRKRAESLGAKLELEQDNPRGTILIVSTGRER